MQAFPLRGSNRKIYAYACGWCHEVGISSQYPGTPDTQETGPHKELVESSKRNADQCCACRRCGAVKIGGWGLECRACTAWSNVVQFWRLLAIAVKENAFTEQAWRALWESDDDE
jgi:hypothetical protein